jgi:hypothetical protein
MRRYFNPFRLASYLLVFYSIGHTLGAVVSTPKFGAASDAVVNQMKSVHLHAQGADATWYGFYEGFGWFVTVFFGFSIVMTWFLGGMSKSQRRAIAPMTWALFLAHVAALAIACTYFFLAPILLSSAIALLLATGCASDLWPRSADRKPLNDTDTTISEI